MLEINSTEAELCAVTQLLHHHYLWPSQLLVLWSVASLQDSSAVILATLFLPGLLFVFLYKCATLQSAQQFKLLIICCILVNWVSESCWIMKMEFMKEWSLQVLGSVQVSLLHDHCSSLAWPASGLFLPMAGGCSKHPEARTYHFPDCHIFPLCLLSQCPLLKSPRTCSSTCLMAMWRSFLFPHQCGSSWWFLLSLLKSSVGRRMTLSVLSPPS